MNLKQEFGINADGMVQCENNKRVYLAITQATKAKAVSWAPTKGWLTKKADAFNHNNFIKTIVVALTVQDINTICWKKQYTYDSRLVLIIVSEKL